MKTSNRAHSVAIYLHAANVGDVMKQMRTLAIAVSVLASLALTGCVTYSQPRYGSEGVYYDHSHYRTTSRVHINPAIYPYWSLDYFYFSRHYHPYSVMVHRYDPWFYPYPGWYYGYHPGPRTHLGISYRYHYPWSAWGPHYGYYRPWQPSMHFSYWHVSTPRHHHHSSRDRVRVEDLRLRELQQRQAAADRRVSRHRHTPTRSVPPRMPATSRQQQPRHAPETSSRRDRGILHPRTTREPRGQTPQSRTPSRERTRTPTRSESSQRRRDPPAVQRTPSRQDRSSTSGSQSRSEPRTRSSSRPVLQRSDSGAARSSRSSERRRDRDRDRH